MPHQIQFPAGDYYALRDDIESLQHESAEDAIVEEFDGVDRSRPVTVFAYRRLQISDQWIDNVTEWMLDCFSQQYADEYGDPDGDGADTPEEALLEAQQVIHAAVVKLVAATHVWACEVSDKIDLTADQVEAVLRDRCPEWFTPEAAHAD